jgi:hypothetical protein
MIDWTVLQQRIDELAGTRRSNVGRAAVRLDDLNELLRIPEEMKAETASGSISVANFNALLNDVREVHKALRAVASIIRGKRGR